MKSRQRVKQVEEKSVKLVKEERPRLLHKGINGRYEKLAKKSKNILIR